MGSAVPVSGEREFLRPASARRGGMAYVVGGALALCLAVAGFFYAIHANLKEWERHGVTTLPVIFGIGSLAAGLTMLRGPSRVAVGPRGLVIDSSRGEREVRWDDVGYASVDQTLNHRRRLNIADTLGKSIVKVDESFSDFDELVSLVGHHVSAKGDDTEMRLLRKKARGMAFLSGGMGLFMCFGCVFLIRDGLENQRAERLLMAKGERGQGDIVRLFVAPNGTTRRLEYSVRGTKVHNVEVEPDYWNELKTKKTVPVMFVPDEPQISRLVEGQVKNSRTEHDPKQEILIGVLSGALALFMLVYAPFAWKGWDLAHDKQTKQWSLKRYGKVVRVLGGRKPAEWYLRN